MSLICANCHREIVVSDTPTHYGFHAGCEMTKEGIKFIEDFKKQNNGDFQQ
jgi:hypothetical protein